MENPDFVDVLNCNDRDPQRERFLFLSAVEDGKLPQVKSIIARHPHACEWATDNGYTAVQQAIYHGRQEVLEFLLESGADINRRGRQGTPLIHAVHSHDPDAARWLLSKGADASLTNPAGETPLMWAVLNEMRWLIHDLVKACPESLNIPDNNGDTPLARAAEWGYAAEARVLIRHGARIDARNKAGETPSDVAVRNGHMGIPDVIRQEVDVLAQHVRNGLEKPAAVFAKPLRLAKPRL